MRPTLNLLLILLLSGCTKAYTRDYHTMTVFDSSNIQNKWYTSQARFNALYSKDMLELDRSIRNYLQQHPETSPAVARALMNYQLSRGMTKDEVLALIGRASSVRLDEEAGTEVWSLGKPLPMLSRVKLTFEGGYLVHIQSHMGRTFPY